MEEEDLIILNYFKDINDGYYVDVGCYHPLHLSNTFLLHKKGWNGVNIDISEYTIDLFNYLRPRDTNINTAVTNFDGSTKFYYQKKLSQLSSIKKNTATKRMQGKIDEKEIKAYKLSTILSNTKYRHKKINFLNIDAEDSDFDVLCSIDFKIYRPDMICVEIIEEDIFESNIYRFLNELNYKKIWSSKSNWSHIFIKK
jgi:hypothetical protein